jgi:hypothetical protein
MTVPTWLFVSYGGGHVKALLPVARRVRELGFAHPVYLALTTAMAAVRADGIETLGFRDLLLNSDHRACAHGERLAAQLAVQAADHDESVAYLGLSYADLEDRLGAAQAADAYARFSRQAFLPLSVLERVFDRLQPSLVVATNSPRAEEAAILTARKRRLPSVCLLDLFGIWERQRLARHDFADALCVLNESVRDSLVSAGRPPQDVRVTGNPAFDTVLDPALIAAGAALRHDAGWDGLHVCLYASSPEPAAYPGLPQQGDPAFPRRIESALLDAVIANPSLAIWVRRHPSEPAASEVAALGHPRIRVSPTEMPLHACIHASDEVLVMVSTVGVEANLAGKYVTQIRGSIFDNLSPYLAMGIAQRELTLEQLAAGYEPPHDTAVGARREAAGTATDRVVEVLQSAQAQHGR